MHICMYDGRLMQRLENVYKNCNYGKCQVQVPFTTSRKRKRGQLHGANMNIKPSQSYSASEQTSRDIGRSLAEQHIRWWSSAVVHCVCTECSGKISSNISSGRSSENETSMFQPVTASSVQPKHMSAASIHESYQFILNIQNLVGQYYFNINIYMTISYFHKNRAPGCSWKTMYSSFK